MSVYRNPDGTELCGRSTLSGSERRSAPERGPRSPAKRGSIRVVAFRASHPEAAVAPAEICSALPYFSGVFDGRRENFVYRQTGCG
jgi:hypothetical protein